MSQVPASLNDPDFRAWLEKTQDELAPMIRSMAGQEMGSESVEETMMRVALSLTVRAWRNTVVEDWHAERRLSDGDMLRINSHTTWAIRQRLLGWCREIGIDPTSPSAVLEDVDVDDVERLAVRLYRWLIRPDRQLANGKLLREVAGEELEELDDKANGVLGGLLARAAGEGVRQAFAMTALGGLYSNGWWGTARWPQMVDVFLAAMDDMNHTHWGKDGQMKPRSPEPFGLKDRAELRTILLESPWKLDADSAEWITNNCIGMVRLAGE